MEDSQLITIVKESGLQQTKAEALIKSFAKYFDSAGSIVNEARSIVVTDENDIEGMKKARAARLSLKSIRIDAENLRKELKADALRENNAIDGVNNVLKALIVPVEEHLEEQEKFAEIRIMKRNQQIYEDRIAKLSAYVYDVGLYNLKDMTDEAFDMLLNESKIAKQAKEDAEVAAEKERIAAQKAYQEEQIRIRAENEKLRAEAVKKEAAIEIERKKNAEVLRKAQEEKTKVEEKLRAERDIQEKAKAQENARILAEQKIKEDEERKKLLAPDKEKLLFFRYEIDSIRLPVVTTKEASNIVREVEAMLMNISDFILEKTKRMS